MSLHGKAIRENLDEAEEFINKLNSKLHEMRNRLAELEPMEDPYLTLAGPLIVGGMQLSRSYLPMSQLSYEAMRFAQRLKLLGQP